ncbi:hypothetical protein D3C76_841730 [compost metagenome]
MGIDVDTPDLVGEGIDQVADGRRVVAEQAQLLAVVGVEHIIDHLLQVAVGHHRHQWPKLLFMVDTHVTRNRIKQRRVEERASAEPAAFVEHSGTLAGGIGHQAIEVVELARLRQRCQCHARLPRHTRFERGQLALELVEESVDHRFVDEQNLQRGAALAVERQGAGDRLFHGVVEVDLGQHDARVLGVQAERRAQAVRARMKFLQVAGGLVGADEGEHIDLAAGHQRADRLTAAAIDHVDHPWRETVAEGFEQRANQ